MVRKRGFLRTGIRLLRPRVLIVWKTNVTSEKRRKAIDEKIEFASRGDIAVHPDLAGFARL